jgi:LacI family transcriptional regulator, galactose operon repressor
MSITIRDVAKRLNLSITTVSRALDGYDDVAEETRQLIVKTAQEMGYVPNRAARQLRRKKADAVGYILPANTPRFADPFFSEFIAGLGDETAYHPFDLVISIAPPGEESEKRMYQNWVQGRKVDGFILTHLHLHDWRVQYLSQQGASFTALENTQDGFDFPRVEVDRQGGMVELVTHLLENGFRRVAYLGGAPELKIQADQFDGYRRGLEIANIPYDSNLVTAGDLTSAGGYIAIKRMLSIPDPPNAIACINDEKAFGVLHAAHELGFQIGRDLAVAGFDGVKASSYTEPPLTTLDIPVYDIARQLVNMLVAEIVGYPLPDRRVVLQPKLLIRESTGGNLS